MHVDANADNLIQKLGWIKLDSQRKIHRAVMVYKLLNGRTPDYLSSKFVDRSSVSSNSLKDTEGKLAIPQAHTNYMKCYMMFPVAAFTIKLIIKLYRKIHSLTSELTSEFHGKFYAKNRYHMNQEAMSTILVFGVKFTLEFTSLALNFFLNHTSLKRKQAHPQLVNEKGKKTFQSQLSIARKKIYFKVKEEFY